MANRRFHRAQALEREVKTLHVELTMASGAPTLTRNLGVESVARTAAGEYKITLQDKYFGFLNCIGTVVSTTAADWTVQVKSESVSTNKELEIFVSDAGTPSDPADGDKVLLSLELKNSSVVR